MIPCDFLTKSLVHDGDEEFFIVTNGYGEIVYECDTAEEAEAYINGRA